MSDDTSWCAGQWDMNPCMAGTLGRMLCQQASPQPFHLALCYSCKWPIIDGDPGWRQRWTEDAHGNSKATIPALLQDREVYFNLAIFYHPLKVLFVDLIWKAEKEREWEIFHSPIYSSNGQSWIMLEPRVRMFTWQRLRYLSYHLLLPSPTAESWIRNRGGTWSQSYGYPKSQFNF